MGGDKTHYGGGDKMVPHCEPQGETIFFLHKWKEDLSNNHESYSFTLKYATWDRIFQRQILWEGGQIRLHTFTWHHRKFFDILMKKWKYAHFVQFLMGFPLNYISIWSDKWLESYA